MAAIRTCIANDATPRLAGATFLSDPMRVADNTVGKQLEGMSMLLGYHNSPQASTIDVYQGSFAEVNAITPAVPAAGASDGTLFLNTFAHPAGAGNTGTPIGVPIRAEYVRVRRTVGGVNEVSARTHVDVLE